MSYAQRARTAANEAGHGAVGYMLGRHVDVVSIRPGEHWLGVAVYRQGRLPRADVGKTLADLLLWPAEWRRAYETSLAVIWPGALQRR